MSTITHTERHNLLLAVLGGRFLPINEIDLSVERDSQNLATANSIETATVVSAAMVTVNFTTCREPMLQPRKKVSLRLYTEKIELTIDNVIGVKPTRQEKGNSYRVEVVGKDIEKEKR